MAIPRTKHHQYVTGCDLLLSIWDHELCSSILSTFLHANSNEMYCCSLINMKASLENKCSKGLTYTNIFDLANTRYQEAKGVHTPRTPRHSLCLLPDLKSMPMSSISQRASPPLGCKTRATTLATFVVKKSIGPTNVQKGLALKPSLTLTLPSPMDDLWDLHNALDTEIHVATVDTAKKDEEDSRQTNKVGNTFLQPAQSPPSL